MNQPSPALGPQARGNGHAVHPHPPADPRKQTAAPATTIPQRQPLPVPHARGANGQSENMRPGAFPGPRSPPGGKNTSHVPCKFYRQGACQAGPACPFLHSDSSGPCKYFQKGNCKFGMKCANDHITADGRRINKTPNFPMGQGHLNLGGRVMPNHGPPQGSSLISMQHNHVAQPQPVPGSGMQDDYWGKKSAYEIPTIDTTFSSHPGSTYGSPPNDGRMPLSPNQKPLSTLDAPLPASFDSQGVSIFARNGPIAASVPSRFGFETSPPSSIPGSRPILQSSTLRNLHSSAFGDDSRNGRAGMGTSPVAMEDTVGRRIMHSERFSRPKMLSASVGARAPLSHDDWDEDFAFEEDLVPTALQDLLTPQEKLRRLSRTAEDENILSYRASLSGIGTPAESSSKVGSPNTNSPSRFSALFSRQQQQKNNEAHESTSMFGHVGSPLRPSALNPGTSPSLRAVSRPTSGEFGLSVASPPRQASMSMISQQLQRTRLSSRASDGPPDPSGNPMASLHPGINRVSSSGSATGAPSRLDRAASSSSVNVGRETIDEEPELFKMDEVGDSKKESTAWKRLSGGGNVWGTKGVGVIGGQRSSSGSGA